MTEEKFVTKLPWYKCQWLNLINSIGCAAPFGFSHKVFNKLAGTLTCVCCVFWRGFILGAIVSCLLFLLSLLLLQF